MTEIVNSLNNDQQSRFGFGLNWKNFLNHLSQARIDEAECSLKANLKRDSLVGLTFIDIGSGSGLFSLAARRLGATVTSFDYDENSVACTSALKQRYFLNDNQWNIAQGSILDRDYVESLGQFDIVYSWGVLHHTGQMWNALSEAEKMVKPDGQLFISIYNDQGCSSRHWSWVKKLYNRSGIAMQGILLFASLIRCWGNVFLMDLLQYGKPLKSWQAYSINRGMSPWYDLVDWVGGYPFEVAKPEEIFEFFQARGYVLRKLKTCAGGLGCNEFVFKKASSGGKT